VCSALGDQGRSTNENQDEKQNVQSRLGKHEYAPDQEMVNITCDKKRKTLIARLLVLLNSCLAVTPFSKMISIKWRSAEARLKNEKGPEKPIPYSSHPRQLKGGLSRSVLSRGTLEFLITHKRHAVPRTGLVGQREP
jgi:hypothetical protein